MFRTKPVLVAVLFTTRLLLGQGLPVESELVRNSCGACHPSGANHLMSRISGQRKTPEGWEDTVDRMGRRYGVKLSSADARKIIHELAQSQGLTASELEKIAYILEGREVEEQVPNEAVKSICVACHSYGKIAAQRRTKEEWLKLKDFHLSSFPLVGSAVEYEHRPSDWPAVASIALDYLAQQFPLETPEWKKESNHPPPGESSWAVVGHELGGSDYVGRLTLRPSADGIYQSVADLEFADGHKVKRAGEGLWYGGYAWRGNAMWDDGKQVREVFHLSADGTTLKGRWLLRQHRELGGDEVCYREAGAGRVLAVFPRALKAPVANTEIHIFGVGLPGSLKAGDLNLGEGVKVESVQSVASDRVVARVTVPSESTLGLRDVHIGQIVGEKLLRIYDKVDYIRVFPERGIARLGGASGRIPKLFAQFEAVAFNRGPDGVEGTDDDFAIGPVHAAWSIEEYFTSYFDDDKNFVGSIDQAALFTPAGEEPNPLRYRKASNAGDVWIVATYKPEGEKKGLKARAYLLVTFPLYIKRMIP